MIEQKEPPTVDRAEKSTVGFAAATTARVDLLLSGRASAYCDTVYSLFDSVRRTGLVPQHTYREQPPPEDGAPVAQPGDPAFATSVLDRIINDDLELLKERGDTAFVLRHIQTIVDTDTAYAKMLAVMMREALGLVDEEPKEPEQIGSPPPPPAASIQRQSSSTSMAASSTPALPQPPEPYPRLRRLLTGDAAAYVAQTFSVYEHTHAKAEEVG